MAKLLATMGTIGAAAINSLSDQALISSDCMVTSEAINLWVYLNNSMSFLTWKGAGSFHTASLDTICSTDLPDGHRPAPSCQAPRAKIFLFSEFLICRITAAIPHRAKGRIAIVTTRGAECGGRGWAC